jgi:hypothetical protein
MVPPISKYKIALLLYEAVGSGFAILGVLDLLQ